MSSETLATRPKLDVAGWAPRSGDDICICGIGARTAVGLSAQASAAAVRGGISGIQIHPEFVDQESEPVSFAFDAELAVDVPLVERMGAMMQSVSEEALSCGQPGVPPKIDSCWIALPEPRRGITSKLADSLVAVQAESLGLSHQAVRTLAYGHAGGLMAMQAVAQSLSRGEGEAALVLGVDSYHDRGTVESLDIHRRLMSARNREGFPPGEAAGACLLVRSGMAARQGLPVLAHIRSVATATEPHPLRATEPCLGEGLSVAISTATGHPKLPQELVTATYCDLNGERYRNEEFVYALLRTQEAFVDAHDYLCPADCWGDVGAASGVLYAVLAVVAGMRGYAKGALPLLWAGSDSGHRSALLLALARN